MAPEPATLTDTDALDELLEAGEFHWFVDCCSHTFDGITNRIRYEFTTGHAFTFISSRADEIVTIIQANMRLKDRLEVDMLDPDRTLPFRPQRVASFEEQCIELDKFIRGNHICERKHVHSHNIKDVLDDKLLDEVQKVHEDQRALPTLIGICTVLLAGIGGIIAAAVVLSDLKAIFRQIKADIRQRYPYASKHGYLYFKTDNPKDDRIFYFKDGHFGIVASVEPKSP